MVARSYALILITMVIATSLRSAQGLDCANGDACGTALARCKLAGTVYCCAGVGYTVHAVAANGQPQSCTCESTPGSSGSRCRSTNSASGLAGTFFATAIAFTLWSVLQA
ncbi:hypothetical protein BaRGS_00004684 [Batillaria attramentaria]|uniref:Uncharacterized protein n=1 Tax=Batillaria attramentaria TaxID=370345 RepID=A0ABD0LYA4_9CAEN